MILKKIKNRLARKRRIRGKVCGTAQCPRMSVYRSLTGLSVQIIDDSSGKTIVFASTKEQKGGKNIDAAKSLGKLISEKAKKANIEKVVFDRNSYKYHGRIKALADAAREGGIKF
jgi:large subunit ribosomal protein L18